MHKFVVCASFVMKPRCLCYIVLVPRERTQTNTAVSHEETTFQDVCGKRLREVPAIREPALGVCINMGAKND